MKLRSLFALACLPVASVSFAVSLVQVPMGGVEVCPTGLYIEQNMPHSNGYLARSFGPTPAGTGFVEPGKCGITTMVPLPPEGVCQQGQSYSYSYDFFDFWGAPNPPIDRIFRQELNINSFAGIPPGGKLKFAEVSFTSGESVGFYFDRLAMGEDIAVYYRACPDICATDEVARYPIPAGLPLTQAIPLTIVWTTGRHANWPGRSINWALSDSPPYTPANSGIVYLAPNAGELMFSNGIVGSSCDGSRATQVRFVRPRFE